MDTYLFITLLILIDIQRKPLILITALVQFIIFSVFHANYYFVKGVIYFVSYGCNSSKKIVFISFLSIIMIYLFIQH